MNVKQLELKRLKEALQAIRFTRHMLQSARKPIAQVIRFGHAADVRLKTANRAYARLTDENFSEDLDFDASPVGLDLSELVEQLKSIAETFADEDKRLSKRIERLQKDKSLVSSSVELRRVRKRIQKAREKKEKTARDRRKLGLLELIEKARTIASKMDRSHPRARETIAQMIVEAEQDRLGDWAMYRSSLRHYGEPEAADALQQAHREFMIAHEGLKP